MTIYKTTANEYVALARDRRNGGGFMAKGTTALQALMDCLWIMRDEGIITNDIN